MSRDASALAEVAGLFAEAEDPTRSKDTGLLQDLPYRVGGRMPSAAAG